METLKYLSFQDRYDGAYETKFVARGAFKAQIPRTSTSYLGFPFKSGCSQRKMANTTKPSHYKVETRAWRTTI